MEDSKKITGIKKSLRVGLITMHRVINVGSVLQAYALQKCMMNFGIYVEIIDYIYPNIEHQIFLSVKPQIEKKISIFGKFKYKIESFLYFLKQKGKSDYELRQEKFKLFLSNHCRLSPVTYYNRYELGQDPPEYDIFVTGSDQVWNPNYIGYDTTFLLGFTHNIKCKRIAYAPSISVKVIPSQFKEEYKSCLSQYDYISVRESFSVGLIHELIDTDVKRVCDPTLLLTKEEWSSIVKIPTEFSFISENYFIVYILNYKFDPYPKVFEIIEKAHRKIGGRIVVLEGEINDYMKSNGAIGINKLGPEEFLYFMSNAKFIVTTSFHGTIFSLNLEKPFICVMNSSDDDTRLKSILEDVGAQKFGMTLDSESIPEKFEYDDNILEKIENFRSVSKEFLRNALFN